MSSEKITKIVMLGKKGVGKSSLLASMYPLLQSNFRGNCLLYPYPDSNTDGRLKENKQKMENLGKDEGFVVINKNVREEEGNTSDDRYIKSTEGLDRYEFALSYANENGSKPSAKGKLEFIDLPGGWSIPKDGGTGEIQAHVELKDADYSFWCIDSLTLMGKDAIRGSADKAENMVKCIRDCNFEKRHSVILVLLRAETFIQNGERRELHDKFRSEYAQHVLEFRKNRKIASIHYCSVQTTGNLMFTQQVPEGERFVRHANRDYNPTDCDVPILCVLQEALESAINGFQWDIHRITRSFPFFRLGLCSKPARAIEQLKAKRDAVESLIAEKTEKKVLCQWW